VDNFVIYSNLFPGLSWGFPTVM